MPVAERYLVACMFVIVANHYSITQSRANNLTAVENELNNFLNQESSDTKRNLLEKYPQLFQIAALIFNKTLSGNQSICDIVAQNFMDRQCSSTPNQTCIGRYIPSSYRNGITDGCHDAQLTSRSKREVGIYHETSDNHQRSKANNSTMTTASPYNTTATTASTPLSYSTPTTTVPSNSTDPHNSTALFTLKASSTPRPPIGPSEPSGPGGRPGGPSTPGGPGGPSGPGGPGGPGAPGGTGGPGGPGPPVANFYFLALNIIARTVSTSYERQMRHKEFDRRRLVSMSPGAPGAQGSYGPPGAPGSYGPSGAPGPEARSVAGPGLRPGSPGQGPGPPPGTGMWQGKESQSKPQVNVTLNHTSFQNSSNKHFFTKNSSTPNVNNNHWIIESFLYRNMTWFNYTVMSYEYPAWFKTIEIINITGHSCSVFNLFLLISTYFMLKREFTLMDRNIVCLSLAFLLAHLLQLNMVFFSAIPKFCKWGAVFLHWSLLLSFMWIAAISFDLYITFKHVRPITLHAKNQRFKKNSIVVLGASMTIVVICVAIGIPSEDFSGYGDQGRCFIVKFWSNLFAFVVPFTILLVASIVLTVLTIHKLHCKQKESNKVLSNGNSRASSRKKIVVAALVLKLSILFGFGWFTGFINGFIGSTALYIIFNVIVSFQGTFVYLAFGEQKSMFQKCFNKVKAYHQGEAVSKGTDNETTYVTTAI